MALNFQSHFTSWSQFRILYTPPPKKYGGSLFSRFGVLGVLGGLCFQDTLATWMKCETLTPTTRPMLTMNFAVLYLSSSLLEIIHFYEH